MKEFFLLAVMLTQQPQQPSKPATSEFAPNGYFLPYPSSAVASLQIEEDDKTRVEIRSSGEIVFFDDKGNETLHSFPDGHITVADPSKVDAQAKLFWQLMAKYAPQFCQQPKGLK